MSRSLWLVLYIAIAATALGANPFKGQTITPFDVLVSQRAWSFVDPQVEVRSYQRSDILNSRLPQWESAKEQIRDGQAPLWNDKIAGGGSFLTVNSNLFTPAFAIFAATPDPALGFYLAMLANLAIAGLGMHLFLRRHLGVLASVTGAITFELCGFNAAWLYWPHVFTLIWAPWLLWAIDRCAQSPGARNSLLTGCTTALACLGGFPFLSILVLQMAALYALVLWAFRLRNGQPHRRFAGWYAAGTVLGLLLAALPLIGLVYWLQQFDLGYRQGRGSYLDISQWKQLFPPWAYRTQRVEQTMYVGALMMALAITALACGAARWRRLRPLPVFGVLLLIITAGLVFDLWPMWLVQWLPGMSFNAWSRAIGLLSIALIILGTTCLDHLWRRCRVNGLKTLRIAVAAVALLQVIEISMFFRDFNGPVSAEYYFPDTPTIEYVRERSGPFDYVVTDRSFVMSGTLGVYGLREWLAHYFRSPELQAALHGMAERPFHSHRASASRFPASSIKYESTTMADYNVRYVLIDSRHGPDARPPIESAGSAQHAPLPPMPGHRYLQGFSLPDSDNRLTGISVRLATYTRTGLPGRIMLGVHDLSGDLLGQASLEAAGIVDNGFAEFQFEQPLSLPGGAHAFSLEYIAGQPPALPITAWAHTSSESEKLRINDQPNPGTIQYRLHTESREGSRFRRVFAAAGTAVFENSDSPGGPYFVTAVERHADARSGDQVVVEHYSPDSFTLRYEGAAPGYVVVPMSMHRDWKVEVNGVMAEVQLKDGVMPAVPVSVPATIHFEYRARVLAWLFPWLGLLALTLASMYYVDRRHKACP